MPVARSIPVRGIGLAALISIGLYLVVYFTSEPNSLPRRGVAVFIIVHSPADLVWRLIAISLFTQPRFMRRVIIVGAGKAGQTIQKVIKEIQPQPYNIIGFVDDDVKKIGKTIQGTKVLGGSNKLDTIINSNAITDIIFAITVEIKPKHAASYSGCRRERYRGDHHAGGLRGIAGSRAHLFAGIRLVVAFLHRPGSYGWILRVGQAPDGYHWILTGITRDSNLLSAGRAYDRDRNGLPDFLFPESTREKWDPILR